MNLRSINLCGCYKFISCLDSNYKSSLRAYGFIEGVLVNVLRKTKRGLVVEVLGSKYSINLKLAEIIEVEWCDGR